MINMYDLYDNFMVHLCFLSCIYVTFFCIDLNPYKIQNGNNLSLFELMSLFMLNQKITSLVEIDVKVNYCKVHLKYTFKTFFVTLTIK